ncbi:hypothetical protein [Litoreibacter arenae]|uniref:Uncharacterized protein n=1 Tax=Litoreibacter arenae DSM 19593 TaxID=1123360 RepID=S9S5M6_9RHOB|nr:hypothetical protein [Litoreibacter arenae]EPX81499.1 hypothetical protein thalar_00054 [Litoreibacter arenae DSM 19593]
MAKNNRWMTWALEDSENTEITMPWARGQRPDWKSRLAEGTPGLAVVLKDAIAERPAAARFAGLPRHAAS